ncbi:AAA family ATPase [Streptomyces sp. PTM05]|uniref:AAA family ATPase n=1 Tax=Streptantibioticus parmotrematis TaxID=2873249 RepID=A0ABS7QXW2_9ACTN|nr:AAA family ATPase [Streptantibioticus parmotrematis]MBY8888056.1 AAA family ATPase [Streptantibioticus parmotrematis]
MTGAGVILYGPPASGKDTITAQLAQAQQNFALFERLKAGPGRTTGYRPTTPDHIERLAQAGALLYRNARYGAEYAIDREGVSALLESGQVPVLHMGQVAGVVALAAYPLRWLRVLLWCPLETTENRSAERGDKDAEARVKAWHETREDLLANAQEPWSLVLRTDQLAPVESAQAIAAALRDGLMPRPQNIPELIK